MDRLNRFLLSCALGVGLATLVPGETVNAQTTGIELDRIVTKVVQADLAALVLSGGDTIISQGEQGKFSITAETPDGLRYVLVGFACDLPEYGEGCLGVDMQVRYTADARVTMENINSANRDYPAAKVSLGLNEEDEDTVFISHYVILDGGQKMRNLAIILNNVLDFSPKIARIIWP